LVLVYVCIFTAQLIIISPINLEKFSLWLAIAYLVLLLAIFGFGLIYKGAQQLEGIEKAVVKTKQQST
jgi:drug/metabolite transporter (DMT)-like permease